MMQIFSKYKVKDVNLLSFGIFKYVFNRALLLLIISIYILIPQKSIAQDLSEYDIKAGYIYKFIYFIDWPENTFPKSDSMINFAIVGKSPFGSSFEKIIGKTINGRVLAIEVIDTDVLITQPDKYQIIFICSSEQRNLSQILKIVNGIPVLTISDSEAFLEKNGMINFIVLDGNIRFEINDLAIGKSGLKIRSAMKRQAVRIIGDENGS